MDSNQEDKRKGEKGAAMVMVLLISFLLLTASAGLLMETSMNTQNISDATAEQQAYNAAESGLQATINVLRGNVTPNPLIDTSKPASDPANLISFRKAISTSTSNADAGDVPRLSRWLTYNYKTSGSAFNDRVVLGATGSSYNPHTGYAYSVSTSDPDKTGEIVSFNTEAQFLDSNDNNWKGSIIRNFGTKTVSITYEPVPSSRAAIDVSSGNPIATDFGKFRLTAVGVGAATFDQDLRFQIIINMTAPYNATKVMSGWIKLGKIDLNTVTSVSFDFDSPAYDFMGSSFRLNSDPLNVPIGSTVTIGGSITQPEPFRILIKSVGYGPRGARKELEAVVQKNFFNGLSAPATLTLIGGTNGFNFYAGSSQQVTYSGQNKVGIEIIPSIGTTNKANLNAVLSNLAGKSDKADITGYPADVTREMPFWLQSPENLDNTLKNLKRVAVSTGRYFPSGVTPPNIGNLTSASGITYVDGNLTIREDGGGILVVTGKLTLHGAFKFNGLIIVTGAGGIERTGGGNGYLEGNTVVAPYNPADITPNNPNDPPAQFLSPKYEISGGGNSEIVYNSNSVKNGMMAVSNFVLGVAEK